jgi:hypothetical protein
MKLGFFESSFNPQKIHQQFNPSKPICFYIFDFRSGKTIGPSFRREKDQVLAAKDGGSPSPYVG